MPLQFKEIYDPEYRPGPTALTKKLIELQNIYGERMIQFSPLAGSLGWFQLVEDTLASDVTIPVLTVAAQSTTRSQTQLFLGVKGDCIDRTDEITESGAMISLAGHIEGALNVILELVPLSIGGAPGVNFFRMTSHVSGQVPILSAVGPDASVGMDIAVQSSADITLRGGLGVDRNDIMARFHGVGFGVNFLQFDQAIAGNGPKIEPAGTDTNIALNFGTKGTGTFRFNGAPLLVGGDSAGEGGFTGLTNVIGIGNGAGTNLTGPAKGTGSGPASLVVAEWLKVYVGTAVGWVPWCQ